MAAQAALDLGCETVVLACQDDFAGWRDAARRLVGAGIEPHAVQWAVAHGKASPPPLTPPHEGDGIVDAPGKVEGRDAGGSPPPCGEGSGVGVPTSSGLTVPRAFVEQAEAVICHADPARFDLLYRVLLRLKEEPSLLAVASDPAVVRLREMEKAVRRDIHKMRAFVRFVRVGDGQEERYVAWFEPSHNIVRRNAPFFVRRFTGMRWAILTPRGSGAWDGEELTFGPAATKADAPREDATDELWRTYFASIFNPARLKVKAMQAEMPKKYWRNLPEASLIPELIRGAEKASRQMIEAMPTMPAPHHDKVQARHWPPRAKSSPEPEEPTSLAEAGEQAKACRRCPLWRDATQTVFGEGPEGAEVVFVGEQPGDQEDLAGKPFVGPAGKVFDTILDNSGIDRRKVYVTNAVKHFKFEPRGKRRIHSKPNAGEVQACRWWLDKELGLLKPKLAVALGATAAQSLLGRTIPVTKMRSEVLEREDGLKVFVTIHPSYILRIPDPRDADAERARFLDDLKAVRKLMDG